MKSVNCKRLPLTTSVAGIPNMDPLPNLSCILVYQDKFQMDPKCKIKKYQKQAEASIIIAKGEQNPPNKIKDEYISTIKLILLKLFTQNLA